MEDFWNFPYNLGIYLTISIVFYVLYMFSLALAFRATNCLQTLLLKPKALEGKFTAPQYKQVGLVCKVASG